MRVIELREGVAHALTREELSEDEAVALHATKTLKVGFPTPLTQNRYTLESDDVVGHIPVGPDLLVRIQPKTPIANLFRLLETVYDLSSFRFSQGWTGVETVAGLYERLAQVLALRVLRRVRVGLYREYVAEEERLQCVRGRIDVTRTLIACNSGTVGVHCRYHDLTEDLDDNAILLWTLRQLLRAELARDDVRQTVRRAFRALAGSITEREFAADDCLGRSYHRLNSDYAVLHALCALLLDALGPNIPAGTQRMLPFQLNPWNLFERFLALWLKQRLKPRFHVEPKRRLFLQASEKFTFEVDIVVSDSRTRDVICVIDAKYKVNPTPSPSDFNQVVVYAMELGARHALLAYPFHVGAPFSARIRDIAVRALSFDLALDVERAGDLFLQQLLQLPAFAERDATSR